jgi:hypothetical protein
MDTTRDLLDRRASVRAISTPESDRDRLRRRNAVEGSLRGMLPGLGLDELRILERQAEKMLRHKREYGELVIATDGRNHRAEAADEHRDALFYMLVEEIKRSDERIDRLRCEAADEIASLSISDEEERHASVMHTSAIATDEATGGDRVLVGLRELRDVEIVTQPARRLTIDERFDDDGQFDDADVGGEDGEA